MDSTKIGLQNAAYTEKLTTFGELETDMQQLLSAAVVVRKQAYCPYSKFKVGAAFRGVDKNVWTGCNVENAALTPGNCAERSAICKAVSEGCRRFTAAGVVAYQPDSFTTPCGVCRQFIMEFADKDFPIYIMKDTYDANADIPDSAVVFCTSVYNLLPHGFRSYEQ